MNYLEHTYSKVQYAKGAPRIWMEGRVLERAGFLAGTRYTRTISDGVIELRIAQDGNLAVSERKAKQLPLIEINNQAISPVTEGADELRIDFGVGVIRITVAALTRNQREREARLASELQRGFISKGTLCSGIGMSTLALSQAFHRSGINPVQRWVVDREGKYHQVAWDNNPAVRDTTQIFTASLEELEPELLRPVSVLNVSLPCTGHSNSGKAKNKIKNAEQHKTDATAVFGFMRIVQSHVNPAIIVSENVPQAQDSATYQLIKGMLDVLGYNIYEVTLDSEQSGCFQNRSRYWFVAVSKGLSAVNTDDIPRFARQYSQLGELMDDIPDDSRMWAQNQYLKDKAIADKAAGKGFQRSLVDASSTSITTINRTYHKKQSTPSMVTRQDGMERLLTPNEIARSMACPTSLVEGLTQTLAIEGLGQGVDCNQCRGIGLAVVRDVLQPMTMRMAA